MEKNAFVEINYIQFRTVNLVTLQEAGLHIKQQYGSNKRTLLFPSFLQHKWFLLPLSVMRNGNVVFLAIKIPKAIHTNMVFPQDHLDALHSYIINCCHFRHHRLRFKSKHVTKLFILMTTGRRKIESMPMIFYFTPLWIDLLEFQSHRYDFQLHIMILNLSYPS